MLAHCEKSFDGSSFQVRIPFLGAPMLTSSIEGGDARHRGSRAPYTDHRPGNEAAHGAGQGRTPRRLTGLSGARFQRQCNDGGWRAHLKDQGITELRAVNAAGVPGQSARWITWSLLMTITEPERLSLEKLRGLASAAPPCISIVLLEREARDARIAFKDALAQVRAKLAASASRHDIASLLDPLELAATNVIDSSKEPATFIFLRSPDVCPPLVSASICARCWRLPANISSSTFSP